MKTNKGIAPIIVLVIILGVLAIGGGAYWMGKNEYKVKFINFDKNQVVDENNKEDKKVVEEKKDKIIDNVIVCDLNKSYNAPYSFSPASGPKIDYLCNCPDNSYIMTISSYSGMDVVLGNGGSKTIEYQCVKDFKICPIGYKLTSYSDLIADSGPGRFTCTKD